MSTNLILDNELGEIRLDALGQEIGIKSGPADSGANGSGGQVRIEAASGGTGEGDGGDLILQSGDPGSDTNPGGFTRNPGTVFIRAGSGQDSIAPNFQGGGNIDLLAGLGGNGSGALGGGSINLTAGWAYAKGQTGGEIRINGGSGYGNGAGSVAGGGGVLIHAGTSGSLGGTASNSAPGLVELYAGGSRGNNSANGGIVDIRAGGADTASGGALTIFGGRGNIGGGSVTVGAGSASGAGAGGALSLHSGKGETGGAVTITAKTSSAGPGSDVTIQAGHGGGEGAYPGGDVLITAGDGGDSDDGGSIILTAGDQSLGNIPGYIAFRNAPNETLPVELRVYDEDHINYINITTPEGNFGADVDFRIPSINGAGGQFLATDGQGNLGWGNPVSVSGTGGLIQSDGSYAPEGGAGLGVGQVWGDETSSRSANTTYTNTSSCPIAVAITFATNNDTNSAIFVNGIEVAKWDVESINPYSKTLYAIVPPGHSYIGWIRGSSITKWMEMATTGSCGNPSGLGVNQLWTGQSRATNTVYTNNTGSPIAVSVKFNIANNATATLRTASGAPGAGDEIDTFNASSIGSAAGDNFVTLFGVIPDGYSYDMTASGTVLIAGWYEMRGSVPQQGGGLGIGQTWVDQTGSRSASTEYNNADSCPRHVQILMSGTDGNSPELQLGASGGPFTYVSRHVPLSAGTVNFALTATIPASRSYQLVLNGASIVRWQEMAGGTCSAANLTKIIDSDLDTYVRVAETSTGDQDRIDMVVGDNSGDYDVTNPIMELSTGGVTISVPDANGNNSNADGGSVTIEAGDGDSSGTGGAIFLQPGYGGSGAPAIPTGTGVPEPTELWFVDGQGTPQYVGFKAPDTVVTNTIWTLPDDDGTSNQRLVTDGGGVLSWDDPVAPGGPDTAIQYNTSGAFDGEADLTWNATTNVMTVGSSGTPGTITSPVTANLTIATADNTGTTDVGGNVTVQGADALASATAGSAGKISLLSGGGQNLVSAADIDLTAGDMAGATKATGGNVNIEAGDGYGGGEGGPSGGRVNITGGNILAGSGSGGGSGDVVVTGGAGGGSYPGGDVRLRSGSGDQAGNIELLGGSGSNGGGGNLFVTMTNHTTGAGGDISMDAGDSGGSAKGGDFSFVAGRGNGTGDGGDIWLTPGEAVDGGAVHGRVIIDDLSGAAGTPARLAFKGTTTPEYVQIQAPTSFTSGTFTMTLPSDEGVAGQVLSTNGSDPATLSWITLGSAALSWPLLANPNGTSGAPAYSFSGKATVGMYSDAANTIGFATDGDPRVVITNTATTLKREGAVEHELHFEDGTDGTYVGLKAPDNVTTQVVWALPVADGGTDGEVLATDSSGQLKFNKMAYVYSSAGSAATGHTITHNLNQRYVTYTIYDRPTGQKIVNAATEIATDANTLTLTFTVAQDIIVSIMGVPGLTVNT